MAGGRCQWLSGREKEGRWVTRSGEGATQAWGSWERGVGTLEGALDEAWGELQGEAQGEALDGEPLLEL